MQAFSRIDRLIVTISLCGLAIAAAGSESLTSLLEFDRQAIIAGQWWRVATGHVVHWNADHCCWDLLMFALLSAVCELESRARLLLCLATAAALISGGIGWLLPDVDVYRGLSGLDSALFTMVLAGWLVETADSGQRWMAAGCVVALGGFASKVVMESVTGKTLFVDSSAAGFMPLPLVHLIGGVVGIVAAFPWNGQKPSRIIRACGRNSLGRWIT